VDYSILRIFSCLTNSLVDSQKETNWSPSLRSVSSRVHQRSQEFQTLRFRDKESFYQQWYGL